MSNFDSFTLNEITTIHSTLLQFVLDKSKKIKNEMGFEDLRNLLVLYLKILNAADRIEITKSLTLTETSLRYPDTNTRCRLVYYPKSKLFARLFLYDKTGTINTVPTIVPMNSELSQFFILYLNYLYTKKKNSTDPVFIFGSDNLKIWSDASKDLANYVKNILKENIDKNDQMYAKIEKGISAHKLRHIFVTYLMNRHEYSSECLRLAATLERHEVHQSEVTYMKWTRFGAFKAHLGTPAIGNQEDDKKDSGDGDLDHGVLQYFVPNTVGINVRYREQWYNKPFFLKTMNPKNRLNEEKERQTYFIDYGPFYTVYAGMDTSPHCTAITFVQTDTVQGSVYKFYPIVLISKKPKNSNYKNIKDCIFTEDETEFFEEVKKKANELGTDILVAVESRLPLGYRVSAQQGRFTDQMTKKLKKVVNEVCEGGKRQQITFTNQASVKNVIRLLERGIIKDDDYNSKSQKAKNMYCMQTKDKYKDFIETVMGKDDNESGTKINHHPYSDIVDSVAVAYWLENLDNTSIKFSGTKDVILDGKQKGADEKSRFCGKILEALTTKTTANKKKKHH